MTQPWCHLYRIWMHKLIMIGTEQVQVKAGNTVEGIPIPLMLGQ